MSTASIEQETAIKPFVVRTENIARDIISASKNNHVPTAKIDFNILHVQTLMRNENEGTDADYNDVLEEDYEKLKNKNLLLSPSIDIKQIYEIEITSLKTDTKLAGLNLSIGANNKITKVYATIKKGSILRYYNYLERDLIEYINKKKLRANILINVWDQCLIKEVQKLVTIIRVNEAKKFDENYTFLVAECIDDLPTRDDELIKHYEQTNSNVDEQGRIDYSKRGYSKSVQEGDVIIEYIRPKKGKPGRSCRGKYIAPREPKVDYLPNFSISSSITMQQSEEKIEYLAQCGGYVTFDNNRYDIDAEVELKEISFKTTGVFEGGLDKNIKINIKQDDKFKDAIGTGMEVVATKVNVEGSIGLNAVVEAKDAHVGGQTHQNSTVKADNVDINIHKGLAIGKTVSITRLEHGVVEADKVYVRQTIGGEIRAKEVIIESIGSHTKVIATKKIEIKSFGGSENKLIIDPTAFSNIADNFEGYLKEIKEKRLLLRGIKKELEYNFKVFNGNISIIEDMKKKILTYKKARTKPPVSMVQKMKQFKELQEKIQSLQSEYAIIEREKESIEQIIDTITQDVFNAQIINHDVYKGHNEIKFVIISPKQELIQVPTEGIHQDIFELKRVDEDSEEYTIVCNSFEGNE